MAGIILFMRRTIVLDSNVLGLVSNPNASPEAEASRAWLRGLAVKGDRVVIPEIADYEVRRELLRARKIMGLQRLETVLAESEYAAITTPVMRKAAEYWAQVRQQGATTASDKALDGDVILAAQVAMLPPKRTTVIIATTNVRHLGLFVNARNWSDI